LVPILRHPGKDETPALRHIWSTVFGSGDEGMFFGHYYLPELCIVATSDDKPVAAGYLFPVGSFLHGGVSVPCAMIYSVAALPSFRNRGFGTAIVNRLITLGDEKGYAKCVLCPSEDSLFAYYSSRTCLRDFFYISEYRFVGTPSTQWKARLTEATEDEYVTLRESLLTGTPHICFDPKAISYQNKLCRELGGGLFRIDTPYGDFCAIVERQVDGSVWVKELLTPASFTGCGADGVLNAISEMFPSGEYMVRMPAPITASDYAAIKASAGAHETEYSDLPGLSGRQILQPGVIRRFGMLTDPCFQYDMESESSAAPWLGLAFD